MTYSYPKNKEEYWQIVDEYWESLLNILQTFCSKEEVLQADQFRHQRNADIVDSFGQAWSRAPDDYAIHKINSWHILCDLCSESYVLSDESFLI